MFRATTATLAGAGRYRSKDVARFFLCGGANHRSLATLCSGNRNLLESWSNPTGIKLTRDNAKALFSTATTVKADETVGGAAFEQARKYKYFRNVEITPEGVAVLRFDGPKSVNTICFEMANETKKLWNDEIHSNPNICSVVFLSAKLDGFIAGADISDIKSIADKQDLIPIIGDGLKMFQHMKTKGVPLVCGMHGPALGGGLEWALWCDYRICSDSPKTKMGT